GGRDGELARVAGEQHVEIEQARPPAHLARAIASTLGFDAPERVKKRRGIERAVERERRVQKRRLLWTADGRGRENPRPPAHLAELFERDRRAPQRRQPI